MLGIVSHQRPAFESVRGLAVSLYGFVCLLIAADKQTKEVLAPLKGQMGTQNVAFNKGSTGKAKFPHAHGKTLCTL